MARTHGIFLALWLLTLPVAAHPTDRPVDAQVRHFLSLLPEALREKATYAFDDAERFDFGWVPGTRGGVTLAELDEAQTHALRDALKLVLSDKGGRTVDAIIATEAALGVIEGSPGYRDPKKYFTAVFGMPGEGRWALRFEGHHLSVNLTFATDRLVAATPLFLGANPETIPQGPDSGLRALKDHVDLAWALQERLTPAQRDEARGKAEWFGGFLTDAGSRRADLGKPAGILVSALDSTQQVAVRQLIAAYVETITPAFAQPYLKDELAADWANLRFHMTGAERKGGGSYYYRLAGKRLLIEHDNHAGGTHIHAVWRDAERDFGGQ